MKLRAYIVDDEPLAVQRLRRLLEENGGVEVTGSATEAEEAVAALSADPPDVCFLDIEMPRMNGFEVLAQLPDQPIVIFTTAYDRYALKAFEVNSIDYLLKPVDPKQLARALAKIEHLRAPDAPAQAAMRVAIEKLAASLRHDRPGYPTRIASRLGDRLWFLDLARVTHFFAHEKLTYAVANGKAYCVDDSIVQLENRLDPAKFIRIHRSTLVNIEWIQEVAPLPGGGLNLQLKDEKHTDLIVARDRAKEFRQRLGC